MHSKKIRRLSCLIFFCAFLFAHKVFSAQALPEFDATYAIQKYQIKLAEARYQLTYTDKGYKFTQDTKLSGVASMFARDTVSAVSYVDEIRDNLLLRKHLYKQTGREKNRETHSKAKSAALFAVKK